MDETTNPVSLGEFKSFHGIDRALYLFLVRDLLRNPSECLQIMGLWLWLERGGYWAIKSILNLPPFLISELADEAVTCLKYINNRYPMSSEIPLIQSLVKREISLQFFRENRITTFHEIQNLVSEIYIPALSDLLEKSRHAGFGESLRKTQTRTPPTPVNSVSLMSVTQTRTPPTPSSAEQSLMQSFSMLSIGDGSRPRVNARYERTMFVTFSKGYPVMESEVRQFFTELFGNCIEAIYMQDVRENEQALYAKVVFLRQSFVKVVLEGIPKAKFTINGKHVWMRQFVPKNVRL